MSVALCSKDLPRRARCLVISTLELDGTLDRIHHALYVKCREAMDREASPTACVIDSQSVKSAEKGARHRSERYDAGKKIKGKKRHILVDTLGLLLHAVVHPADIQDRDAACFSLHVVRFVSVLQKLFADGGYQGRSFKRLPPKSCASANRNRQTLRSGKRVRASAATLVVERTFAWLNRCAVGQGFEISPKRARFSPPRLDSSHAQKTLSELMNFSDRPSDSQHLLHRRRQLSQKL